MRELSVMIVSIRNLFFASFLMVAGVAFAKARDVDVRLLRDGMKPFDVLNAIGAPLEKQELEAKHEELWIYKNTELRFREGTLKLPEKKVAEVKVENIDKSVEDRSIERGNHNDLEDWGAVTPVNDSVDLKDILKGMTKYIDDGKSKKDSKDKSNVRTFRR